MGVKVKIGDLEYEAIDYTVREDATPLSGDDSSGSVGDISVTIPQPNSDATITYTPNAFENPGYREIGSIEEVYRNVFTNPDFLYTPTATVPEDPSDEGTFLIGA